MIPVFLHSGQNGFHRFMAKIARAFLVQSVGLVNEQNAAHSIVKTILRFWRRLADIFRHQIGSFNLHHLAFVQQANLVINFANQAGHGGFAGAGVAGEHQVFANMQRQHIETGAA